VRGETLQFDPVIPGWWDGFQMSYRHGEAIYEIQVENPEHCERGVAWVELDGRRIKDGVIPLGSGTGQTSGPRPHGAGVKHAPHVYG
jgi:cyclic beta-1,2-glucan synthetase